MPRSRRQSDFAICPHCSKPMSAGSRRCASCRRAQRCHLKPVLERFWEKVDKNGPRPQHMESQCWLWTGKIAAVTGYGTFDVSRRRQGAHRFSFELAHGAPAKHDVCHRCDVRACVRPDHLFDGTRLDNVRDMMAKGRKVYGPYAIGEQHPQARLRAADVIEIRRLSAAGTPTAQLAASFGIHRNYVRKIVTGRNWKHVGQEQAS